MILIKTLSLLFKMTFALLRSRNVPFVPHHTYFATPVLDCVGLPTFGYRLLAADDLNFSPPFGQQGHYSMWEGSRSSRLKREERESVQSQLLSAKSI